MLLYALVKIRQYLIAFPRFGGQLPCHLAYMQGIRAYSVNIGI